MRNLLSSFLLLCGTLCAKETVDLLVLGGTFVTMNADRTVLEDGAMAVSGGEIVALGLRKELGERYSGRQEIDASNHCVIPGLINVHNHLPMILLRGLGEGADLQSWLSNIMFPLERELASDRDFINCGTQLGCWEMLRSGTTTFLNSYFLPDVTAQVCANIGMRIVCAHGVVDYAFWNNQDADALLGRAKDFIARWREDPLVTPAIAPHSPYLCSGETLKKAFSLAESEDVLFTLHAAESRWEVETIKQRFGCTPIRYLERLGILGPRVLLAHVIWLDDEELGLLGKSGTRIAHCAQSNMKLANGVPPIPQMQERDLVIGLGTDGAASSSTLDLFKEMATVGRVGKVYAMDASVLPAEDIFAMATIEAARALGMDKQIGSLEVGKRADFVLIGLSDPETLPWHDVYAQLVYSVDGRHVQTVVVDGKLLMRDRKMLNLDVKALAGLVEKEREKVAKLLQTMEPQAEQPLPRGEAA